MKITKAIVTHVGGRPGLELEIDGHHAEVFEPKWTLLDAGVVVLLNHDAYWAETISAVYDNGDGLSVRLRGATRDPQTVALVRRLEAGKKGDLLGVL